MTELSVIVVNYNTKIMTMECLTSVADEVKQIFVVDNASVDGSVDVLHQWAKGRNDGRVFIANPNNVGFAKANNQAIRQCDTEYILLLNSDTIVGTGVLKQLVEWMDKRPDVGACGPKLIYPDGTPQPSPSPVPTPWMYIVRFLGLKHLIPNTKFRRVMARMLRPVLGETLRSHMDPGQQASDEIGFLSGAALLVRREVVEQVGGLDEGYFMYLEDADWCIRIRRAGWKLGYVPEVKIIHYAGASYQGSAIRRSFRSANPESFKSIMRFLYTYYGWGSRLTVRGVISLSLFAQSLFAFPMLVSGNRREVFAFIKGNLVNTALVWKRYGRSE